MQYFVLAISVEGPVPHSILFMFVFIRAHSRTCDYAFVVGYGYTFHTMHKCTRCNYSVLTGTHQAHHMDCNAQWIPKWPPDELLFVFHRFSVSFFPFSLFRLFILSLYFMWHLISVVFFFFNVVIVFVSLCQKRVMNGNGAVWAKEEKSAALVCIRVKYDKKIEKVLHK